MTTAHTQPAPAKQPGVQRQIRLPFSKALEIAYKNIRMRLSRSLLVTSGIVLALAFLMSILASEAMIEGMRQWAAGAEESPQFVQLRAERDQLAAELEILSGELRAASRGAVLPEGAKAFDAKARFGRDWPELQKDLGPLPGDPAELGAALALDSSLVPTMQQWVNKSQRRRDIRTILTSPQELEAKMREQGVPATEEEIAAARTQTRWVLTLALLVAFVGILNAMLMSVTERFREIGTMKCLGALDSFIVKLFLLESLFQGIVGTTLGVLLGLALTLFAMSSAYGEFTWKNPPVGDVLQGMVLCLLVGVGLTVAGAVYPAWQAARMQPIEAMRVET